MMYIVRDLIYHDPRKYRSTICVYIYMYIYICIYMLPPPPEPTFYKDPYANPLENINPTLAFSSRLPRPLGGSHK